MANGFWQDRRVLVTGAAGFIGNWLCEALVEKGAVLTEGIFMGDKNLNPYYSQKKSKKAQIDILNPESLNTALKDSGAEVLVHLASKSIVGKDGQQTIEVNVQGTKNVLLACEKNNVGNVIVASSVRAYYGNGVDAVSEDSALKGLDAYDVSKAQCDALARDFAIEKGMKVNVTRCTHTFGPKDYNQSRAVPNIITQMLSKGKILLHGDGSLERDFLYVKDTVGAYLALAEKAAEKNLAGEAFNFASGESTSIRELAEKIAEIAGKEVPIEFSGEGPGEGNQKILCKKALEVLGWQPKVSLEEGLKETVEWYKRKALH